MAETVTLLRNPVGKVESNPRRRRRRRTHRNPSLSVRSITRPLPDFTDVASGLFGAAVAMQGPSLVNQTRWANVIVSGLFTVGGAMALQAFKVKSTTRDSFVLGGSVITLGKALHLATNGRAGIAPSMAFTDYNLPGLPAGGGGGEDAGVSRNGVLAHAHAPVSAFRESNFAGGGAEPVPTLLT